MEDGLMFHLPEDIDILADLAFEDEPEGAITISISATKLYKVALKAYPDCTRVYCYDDKENN